MTEKTLAHITGAAAAALGVLVVVGSLFVPTGEDPGHTLGALGALMVAVPVALLVAARRSAR